MIRFSSIIFIVLFVNCFNISSFSQSLVNPNATPEAVQLKTFLDSIYGKKIISGQAFEDVHETWLKRIGDASGGKQPAILSLDFMNSMPWRVKNGADADTTTGMAIDWVKNKGGIVEMHWHWDAPKNTDFSTWQGFYTKNTSFDIDYALSDTTLEDYQLLIRDIDIVSEKLLRMQEAGIAVLWRPLHEAEGKWFWWGAKSGESCKKLYRIMYDRMVNQHGINNLIWVWNSYGTTKENWYPGDDVVDIVAWDYPDYNQSSGSWKQYLQLFGDKGKPFAIGEDGKLFNPDMLEKQGWLYFITWAYMIKDPSQQNGRNTAEWINRVFNDPRVITLDDLQPGPKAYIQSPSNVFDYDGDGTEKITFDAGKSYTNQGELVSFVWTINGVEVATGVIVDLDLGLGIHEVMLTVASDTGEAKSVSVIVSVKTPSLTLNKNVEASSTEAGYGNVPENAIDGDAETRWSSRYSDPQWLQVDLGTPHDIDQVIIRWETASAKEYSIQQSNDGENWYQVNSMENMPTGARTDSILNLTDGARYIRIYGTKRNSEWGYSIYELEVYGNENADAQPQGELITLANNLLNNPDWKLYPSVVLQNEYVTIEKSTNVAVTLQIYSTNGKLIKSLCVNDEVTTIPINEEFKKGIYLFSLIGEQSADVKRITVI